MTRQGVPTVLIVDDEMDMRLLVRIVLESARSGIEVVGEATDGSDALAVFDTLHPPEIPDVVILDNRMPVRSGLEVAAEILTKEPVQHIILFSAHLTPEIEAQAKEMGIDVCVSKDDVDRLPDLILEFARSKE